MTVLNTADDIKLGSVQVTRVCKGSTQVWPGPFVPITATGGTITDTTIGGRAWRVHTFSTSGNLVVTDLGSDLGAARALLVAGGASGGAFSNIDAECGGGAGGQVIEIDVALTTGTFPVVVGAGGAAVTETRGVSVNGLPGSDTTGLGQSADGGGYGASWNSNGGNATNGGGAGTSAGTVTTGGVGTRSGGNGFGGTIAVRASGGGAGAGTAGGNAVSGKGGKAGDGLQSDIDGTPTYYGAGAPGQGVTPGDSGLGSVSAAARGANGNSGTDGLGNAGTGACRAGDATSGQGGNGVVKIGYWLEAA